MNFIATLSASISSPKNFRFSGWPPSPICCVRIRSSRSVSSFFATIFSLFVVGWALLPLASGWAWEVKTHQELTEKAIQVVESDLNKYLVENLGLEGGLNESLPGGTPRELMKQGSNDEDQFPRFLNHFHNPISNSGLRFSDSAIDWSLAPLGSQFPGGQYSWNDAREYYFKALTSETKADRDIYWGKTFRALGQVMHLLQDSANPSHVRDDPHPFYDGLHDYMERRSVDSYIGSVSFSPDPSMLEQSGATRSEPFSNLFDRDIYMGGNPGDTLGNEVGITEYTNANFFSDDTIAGQHGTAPAHPSVSELVPATTIPFGLQYLTLPRLGSPSEFKARVAKYTGNQALSKYKFGNLKLDFLAQLRLDDLVYEAYSINLIPRAVGYSAAVLDYFFRGLLSEQQSAYVVCSHPDGHYEPIGGLDVTITLPPSLIFEGQVAFYYDLPDKTRMLVGSDSVTSTDSELGGGALIPLDRLSFFEPVPWIFVFEGEMGPGAKEPRAVVALSGKASWLDPGCPQ